MAPTDNPFKWMFLAQLQKGQEALISYKAGIDILAATLVGSIHLIFSTAANFLCRAVRRGRSRAKKQLQA